MFTPVESAVGGVIIGIGVALALLVDGKIAGCSGVLGPFLRSVAGCSPKLWNAGWLVGMVSGGLINFLLNGSFAFPGALELHPAIYVCGGLLVGAGTRLSKGCTSGHGLCGLARYSPRSLIAVCTFMGVAALTVFLTKADKDQLNPSVAALKWPSSHFAWIALLFSVAVSGATLVLPTSCQKVAAPFVSGLIFGLGLGCAGMTDQGKVRAFLDVTGTWDPSLAFVMGCGLCVTVPAYAWARQENLKPLAKEAEWEAPGPGRGAAQIDFSLVVGAALFGFGWGLCGICPGPAIAGALPNLSTGGAGTWFFVCVLTICASWLACDKLLLQQWRQCVTLEKESEVIVDAENGANATAPPE